MDKDKISVAILGTRGLPARYGGFETFAEQLATQLSARGYDVTVYGRHFSGLGSKRLADHDLIKRRSTFTIRHKYLETVIASLSSFVDCIFQRFDTVILCNAANAPFAFILRLLGIKLIINVDGIERRRSKWNSLGKMWYRLGELTSTFFANQIVCDAEFIAEYYRTSYRTSSDVIAYGAIKIPSQTTSVFQKFGLSPGGYILYVSRLEPENNALGVVQAYNRLRSKTGTTVPIVIVGDAPYAKEYIEKVKSEAGPGVIFTGYQFEDDYRALRAECVFYVQATEVGGIHPASLEAMAYGNAIIANDVPEHREPLGDCALYYRFNDFEDLSEKMETLLLDRSLQESLGTAAEKRQLELFTWEKIANSYEEIILRLLGHSETIGIRHT